MEVLNPYVLSSLEDYEDEYDTGIEKTDLSVKFIETHNGSIMLTSTEIINPFFIGTNGGSANAVAIKDIYQNYKQVYILCVKDNFVGSENLYEIMKNIVDVDIFSRLKNQFAIVQSTISILRNNSYKHRACIVDFNCMTKMFDEYKFDVSNIIVMLPEQTLSRARIISSLYDDPYGAKDISDILAMSSYYNKNYKNPILTQLYTKISTLQESRFWCEKRNCNFNMTDEFSDRQFNYKELLDNHNSIFHMEKFEDIDKNAEKIIDMLSSEKNKDVEYLHNLQYTHKFTDISSALQKSDKRTYYMALNDGKLDLTKDMVETMILSIQNEDELYHIFNSLLVSKDYCHMVLNNGKILDKVSQLFEKFAPIYKVLMGYAWQCFIIEESIMKTKSTKKNRYVFDIETASKLPIFPFIYDDLTQNPYVTIFVDKNVVCANENAVALFCPKNFKDYYGVCGLDEFKWRFNLFISGDPDVNIFKGINWDNYGISGSIMPACIQKKSPLLDNFDDTNKKDQWLNFFNNFYPESDVDMMCNHMSIFEFASDVPEVINHVKNNIPNYKRGDIEVEPIKSLVMIATQHFFTEALDDYNKYTGVDCTSTQMETNVTDTLIITLKMQEYLHDVYYKHKTAFNVAIRKRKLDTNKYVESFMKKCSSDDMKFRKINVNITKATSEIFDSDGYLYINDFRDDDNKVPESENYLVLRIAESVKFKIRSEKIKTIELFRCTHNDLFGIVGKFHLPCVRSYFTGDNVFMLSTFFSAMATGINIEYKYMSGKSDPINIINKYRMRGFGTILSPGNERKHMAYYNNHLPENNMFYEAGKLKDEIYKMFGPREVNDKIFRPQCNKYEYTQLNVEYIKNISDIKEYYKQTYDYDPNEYGIDLFKFKNINDNGCVNPLKDWLSREYYSQSSKI